MSPFFIRLVWIDLASVINVTCDFALLMAVYKFFLLSKKDRDLFIT